MNSQSGVLAQVPRVARYLSFSHRSGVTPEASIRIVQALGIDEHMLVGIGQPLVAHWKRAVDGLRTFPALAGPGVQIPSTQQALWCWLRGDDQGDLVNRSNSIVDSLDEGFRLEQVVDAFKYGQGELGLDLTGYEDGTENPSGGDAVDAAIVKSGTPGMNGSSLVAVQQWVHDLGHFTALPQQEQDRIIGRRKSDNAELEDAPASAHVKRTEQESFDPSAFVLRRSMSWADASSAGMMFVAFGNTLDAFEMQLRRMAGLEDGIPDAVFRFSRAVSGAYYWCPPARDGRLDLAAVTN